MLISFNLYLFSKFDGSEEFIIKNNKNVLKATSTESREDFIRESGKILEIGIKLDKSSIELREFLLDEIEKYLESNKSLLNSIKKSELKELLEDLKKLKNSLEKNYIDLKTNLENLKNKFKSSSNK